MTDHLLPGAAAPLRRRLPWTVTAGMIVTGALAVAAAGLMWKLRQPLAVAPLANGHELRLMKAVVGPEYVVSRGWKWAGRFQSWWRYSGPGRRPGMPQLDLLRYEENRHSDSSPLTLWLVLQEYDPATGRAVPIKAQEMFLSGDGFHSGWRRWRLSGTPALPELVVGFQTIPRDVPSLELRVDLVAGSPTLRFRNPARATLTPTWKPLPLPQTQTNAGRTVTLEGLSAERTGRKADPLHPLEFVEIRRTIHEPGIGPDAFTSTPEWVDEWGNTNAHLMPLTSPAWKLILVTRETEHYPFPDSRHIPLGNELPPGPGEHRRLALSPTALSLGVIDAVWVGSGRFAIENGVVSSATAKPPSEGFDSVWHGPDQRYGGDIHQTALFVRFMPKSGNHTIGSVTEFRTSTGTNRAACDQTSFVHSTGITLAKFSLSQALGTNAADISFIPITPVVFEFIVTPPKP